MGCCGKAKNIAKGYIGHAVEKLIGIKYQFTDDRVRVCQTCDKNYWIGRSLWCSLCKCFVPGKARIEDEKCPLDKWENIGKEK